MRGTLILLHEIYGVNACMHDRVSFWQAAGYTVLCPDLLGHPPFRYDQTDDAYRYYYEHALPRAAGSVCKLIASVSGRVLVMGFSVGATLAWSLCEDTRISGIICRCGSRIRSAADLTPRVPVLAQLALHDSYDVPTLADQLRTKPHTIVECYDASHAFSDPYSSMYNRQSAAHADASALRFLSAL